MQVFFILSEFTPTQNLNRNDVNKRTFYPRSCNCLNPRFEPKKVIKNIFAYSANSKGQVKTFQTCIKAMEGVGRLVRSNHYEETLKANNINIRHGLGLNSDRTLWMILFGTLSLVPVNAKRLKLDSRKKWFKAFVHEQKIHELSEFGGSHQSRISRAVKRFNKTSYLKVRYGVSKESLKENHAEARKYCEFYVSEDAFFACGIEPEELSKDIARKLKYEEKRARTQGTRPYEQNEAQRRKIRNLKVSEKKAHKEKNKKRASDKELATQKTKEAIQLLLSLTQGGKSKQEALQEIKLRHPSLYPYLIQKQ